MKTSGTHFCYQSDYSSLARELVYIHINTTPNALTVLTAKNHTQRPFFQTRQLCHGAVLRSRAAEISKIQDAVF